MRDDSLPLLARKRENARCRGDVKGQTAGNLRREFGGGTPERSHARALCGRKVHERRGIAWGRSWHIFAPRVEMHLLANIGGCTLSTTDSALIRPNQDQPFLAHRISEGPFPRNSRPVKLET
jgi:hypothetical protein